MKTFPVIFRYVRVDGENNMGEPWAVEAFFPYGPANRGNLQCYAHIGQHGEASLGYYQRSKRCAPSQYAELLAELRSIYETEPDAVRLVVKQRLPHDWREHAWRNT